MKILKSEKLKLKNSGILRTSILIPIVCGIFSVFFGGTYLSMVQTIYWWMSIFLFLLLQLISYTNLNIEGKAGNYFNIESNSINRSKIYMAKIFWTIYYGIIGSIVVILVVQLFKWTMPSNPFMNSTGHIAIGQIVIFLNSLWIIPLYFLLQRKLNGLLIILMNFVLSLIIAPFVAGSKFFILLPNTYPYKVAKYFFHIKEAGDILSRSLTALDRMEIFISTILSIILFLILIVVLYRSKQNVQSD